MIQANVYQRSSACKMSSLSRHLPDPYSPIVPSYAMDFFPYASSYSPLEAIETMTLLICNDINSNNNNTGVLNNEVVSIFQLGNCQNYGISRILINQIPSLPDYFIPVHGLHVFIFMQSSIK